MSCRTLTTDLRLLVITIVLAGWGTLLPATAHAECGREYVVVVANKNQPEHRPITHSHEQQQPPHSPKLPCRGPNCSQCPVPAPLVPLPSPVQILPDTKAYVADHITLATPMLIGMIPPSDDELPTTLTISIFHPPRHSA